MTEKEIIETMLKEAYLKGRESAEQSTLRDRFAKAALTGELAAQDGGDSYGYYSDDEKDLKRLSVRVWNIADAMIKQRKLDHE